MFDVHVVGGGPAGCVAAKTASENNLNVVISEEHKNIGMPVQCSGLVSKDGFKDLNINIKPATINEIQGAKVYSPSLHELDLTTNETKACLMNRAQFDYICSQEAERAGVKIQLGKRISKDDLKEKKIIGADGPFSSVARWFGFPKINEYVLCYQAEFENANLENSKAVQVYLSNKLSPGFFSWLIPIHETKARVGIGVYTNLPVKAYFERLLKEHKIVNEIVKDAKQVRFLSGFIPVEVRSKTSQDNVLLVGDAAGQVKATTGGGLVFGCNCARIAGQVISNGSNVEDYDKLWRAKYYKDLAIHQELRNLAKGLTDDQIDSYFNLAKSLGAEAFLKRYGDMDKPTVMIDSLLKYNRMFYNLLIQYLPKITMF
ncbi:NAD(P)/FAD-dependent oxidoreductase [Candidatus Micrarchaeota archaeon]|nr:NAD(P)/FAD-dependent oxidoreductase [Candidatus Micrarchaeota archaeon]